MLEKGQKVVGIIGGLLGQSLSPRMHNAAFKVLEIPYIYVAFELRDIKEAMQGVRGLGIRGLSVTIPYKSQVLNYLDWIEDSAEKMGAVNTIVNEGGFLRGYNTDGLGAYESIRDCGLDLSGANVLILGSGGASRAISYFLLEKCSLGRMMILARNIEKLEFLKKSLKSHLGEKNIDIHRMRQGDFKGDSKSFKVLVEQQLIESSDIIINTTPLGGFGYEEEVGIPVEFLSKKQVVFDIVYRPLETETKLLRQAKLKGIKVIRGIDMLVNQGVLQFELWTCESGYSEEIKLKIKKEMYRSIDLSIY